MYNGALILKATHRVPWFHSKSMWQWSHEVLSAVITTKAVSVLPLLKGQKPKRTYCDLFYKE